MATTSTGLVVGAVLVAAVLHASWNALAHAVTDRLVAFALIGLGFVVVGAVVVALAPAPAPASRPFVVISSGLHVGYMMLLVLSYRLGDFGHVYPLARGTAVALVAVVATTLIGEALPPAHLLGVALVCAGIATLVLSGGVPTRGELPAIGAALATGVVICGYTVLDGLGVRRSGSVIGYTGWLFLLHGLAVVVVTLVMRGPALAGQLRPHLRVGAAGALLSVAAYGLVLWAQTRGTLAPIAALRETSVIVAAAIGTLVFREPFGRSRTAAAALVTLGVVLSTL